MAISVKNHIFTMETEHTMYQMKADAYGVLQHLWYGGKTNNNMEYLLDYPDVGFSGNIYEAGNLRTYSLDTLPQEYAASGTCDFRVPAISITHGDGSCVLDLRYQEYHIKKGKYAIPGLPAVHAGETEAETLEITLKDTTGHVRVVLKYGVLGQSDVITRSAVIFNDGGAPITIQRAHSMCMDIPYGDWEWIHFHGRHAMERQVERRALHHGIQECGSARGTSSHQQNPSVILCEKGCSETSGFCMGAALMYSGGFQTQVEMDQLDQVRIVMGIQPELFSWRLEPGECFYTPEVILSCSTEGLEKLSHRFHSVIRNHVCRGPYQLSDRPVLINNWEATYFDFDEQKIWNIAKKASELGVDMLVLDDGWFGKRDDDTTGLGDWFVNEDKIKGGLKKLVAQINGIGMKFGLWFEPEMVSEDSCLYREHPDWVIRIPGRQPVRSRFQLVLDMSRKEVREYLHQAMSDILKSANIEYVKWDMNRSICDWYSAALPKECQGELPHRYVLGVYELLEQLTTEFPNVLFEGCSGGGGRFDAGMLYYCPQIWCSDDTDAHERTKIQYGTSFFYPISAVGSHVSAVPNHQTGRSTSIDTRGIVAMAGSFGYELDLNKLSEEEKEKAAAQTARFKQFRPLIHGGTYYRLSNPMEENLAAWAFVSQDKSQVLLQGVIFRARANVLRYPVRLRGLEQDSCYRVCGQKESGWEGVYTGAALMEGGILLPLAIGDDAGFELYFEKAKAK